MSRWSTHLLRFVDHVTDRVMGAATVTKLSAFMVCVLLTVAISHTAVARQNLPNMGEPADSTLSPAAERELGEQFMRQIRARVPLVRDTRVSEYIQALGTRLASTVDTPHRQEFDFFVIDNPNINAFAVPGGFVGLNAGLIEVMAIEDQLAGVVAHEIAHITQRHHARASASDSRTRMTTAFAVLAAILIGQSNPQAGQAALAAGLAATQQSMINFTRSNEYEADRIGIEVLSDAAFQPIAMAEAFEILRRKNSINSSGAQIEYLRTHPLDNNRIAEAKNRAVNLSGQSSPDTGPDFNFFKARLRVLSNTDDARLIREYTAQLDAGSTKVTGGAQYALAMLSLKGRDHQLSLKWLEPLLARYRGNINVQLLASEIWFAAGQQSRALENLQQLIEIYPGSYSAVELYSEQLISQRKLVQARQSITEYIRSVSRPNVTAWRQLASVEQKLGKEAASHEALARYFRDINEFKRSRDQLELALRAADSGSQDELRLRAQLKDLDLLIKGR